MQNYTQFIKWFAQKFDNWNLFIYKQAKNYTYFKNMYNFFNFLYIFIENV